MQYTDACKNQSACNIKNFRSISMNAWCKIISVACDIMK